MYYVPELLKNTPKIACTYWYTRALFTVYTTLTITERSKGLCSTLKLRLYDTDLFVHLSIFILRECDTVQGEHVISLALLVQGPYQLGS